MTPRALSFMKRNRPSQQWYSYDHLPSAHLQAARSRQSPSPQHEPKKSSEKKKTRPMSASFSNHHGIFTNPNTDQEYFIIHPDWLSESLTIEKLSLTDRKTKTSTWPPRRCKSAPPPKHRNPITWDNWTYRLNDEQLTPPKHRDYVTWNNWAYLFPKCKISYCYWKNGKTLVPTFEVKTKRWTQVYGIIWWS